MATKVNPHHLVALMNYAFGNKEDGSLRYLDPSLHNRKGSIVDNPETTVHTFPVLDALAHITVSRKAGQEVGIGVQLNSQRQEIRLTVAENTNVMDGVVDHRTLVWRKLRSLSVQYQRNRGRTWDKPRLSEMPKMVDHSFKREIFRNIYRYSVENQMKRLDNWSDRLGGFGKALLKWRLPLDVPGFELSLYNTVFTLSMPVRVVSKLCDIHKGPLTESEWELVYSQSILTNQHVRIVLADRKGFGCEILARELGGMLLLLPITVLIYTPGPNIHSLLIGRMLVMGAYSTSQSVATVYWGWLCIWVFRDCMFSALAFDLTLIL